jgi:hypothetical protein
VAVDGAAVDGVAVDGVAVDGVAVDGMAVDGAAGAGVAIGAGVAHTCDSELHVGYAVRSVTPHASYTPRLIQSTMPTPSNACVCNVSLLIYIQI